MSLLSTTTVVRYIWRQAAVVFCVQFLLCAHFAQNTKGTWKEDRLPLNHILPVLMHLTQSERSISYQLLHLIRRSTHKLSYHTLPYRAISCHIVPYCAILYTYCIQIHYARVNYLKSYNKMYKFMSHTYKGPRMSLNSCSGSTAIGG